jgi:enterochelin esterase family protein
VTVVSPEVLADGRVTFRLFAPNAQQVSVTGIPGGAITMTRGEQGVWTGTTAAALAPDIYQYTFNVDGLTIVDPVNTRFSPAFNRVARSVVQVPGDNAWTPIPGTPRGAIAHHPFRSAITNDEREFFVYTPPGYDPKRRQPYPLIVLQHGLGDDAKAWTQYGGANITLDNLINQGKATPMVMVNTLGYGTANGGAGIDAPEMQQNFTRILNQEVLPVVYRQYNVSTNRNDHAIAGLSMGGGEAIMNLNNIENFAWFGSFSGAFNNWAQTIPFPNPPASPAVVAAAEVAIAAAREQQAAQQAAAQQAAQQAATQQAAAGAGQAAGAGRGGAPAGGRGGFGRGAGSGPVFDARLPLLFPNLNARTNSQIKLLWFGVGTNDTLLAVNQQFRAFLTARGVRHTYVEFPDVGHVWPLWRRNFAEFAQLIFR